MYCISARVVGLLSPLLLMVVSFVSPWTVELCSDMIDVVLDVSGIYGLGPSHEAVRAAAAVAKANSTLTGSSSSSNVNKNDLNNSNTTSTTNTQSVKSNDPETSADDPDTLISQTPDLQEEIVDQDSAYDTDSASVIRLSNGMVLYLKEVDTMLALVCITRSENFQRKSLINYNISCLKRALQALAQPDLEPQPVALIEAPHTAESVSTTTAAPVAVAE